MTPLTCREVVELVTDYLDDALSPEDRERFEEHLALCPGCDSYLDQIRLTVRVVAATDEIDEDAPEMAALMDAFRTYRRTGT
jgi:anti-sigma factor RsiW